MIKTKSAGSIQLLVPLLKAFALPDKVERATQSLRRMLYYTMTRSYHYDMICQWHINIPEDIYRCSILDFV
ncbi:MAG: hypothetical protein K2H98_09175 [Duncaniella sp.]|nr:hypothetical protein [Duncaniella sp.]